MSTASRWATTCPHSKTFWGPESRPLESLNTPLIWTGSCSGNLSVGSGDVDVVVKSSPWDRSWSCPVANDNKQYLKWHNLKRCRLVANYHQLMAPWSVKGATRKVLQSESPTSPRLKIYPNLTSLSGAMFSVPYACGGLSGPLEALFFSLGLSSLGLSSWRPVMPLFAVLLTHLMA